MNNLITFSLILAGMVLLLLRKGTKRQRRANRRLAMTLLLFGLASGGYTYTQQHTTLLGTPPQSSSAGNGWHLAPTGHATGAAQLQQHCRDYRQQ